MNTKKRENKKEVDLQEYITIEGARGNNLKGINLKIPRDKLIVVSGLSGSGKSTLAFETLFAEGQRRFAESLSSFARQFLGRMTKPAVDKIEGIPPAIAIEQKVNTRNPRSTVGTNTEIYDYLRLLYSKIGITYSPISGKEIKRENVSDVIEYISSKSGRLAYILTSFGWSNIDDRVELLLDVKNRGFSRLFYNGELVRIDQVLKSVADYQNNELYILIDRIQVPSDSSFDQEQITRLQDSIQTAFNENNGRLVICTVDGKDVDYREFSNSFEADGIKFEEPTELLFSYNNPLGACPVCGGYGSIVGIDESLVVPNATLSVYEGAIACWRGENMGNYLKEFITYAGRYDFPIHRPYAQLTKEQKKLLWDGNSDITGVNGFFDMVESLKYKIQYKYMLARYSGKTVCRECDGSRLRKEASYVKIDNHTITQLMDMSISNLNAFFKRLKLDDYQKNIAERAIKEVEQRLSYIEEVGLGYLTLNRAANTLSGGESQRINLVSSLGSSLVGSLYILDEPSIGLHPSDTTRLIKVIKRLQQLGNTVLIVEHDKEIISSADQLIDIGPYAGINGGEVVYQGEVQEGIKSYLSDSVKSDEHRSLTLEYLSGLKKLAIPAVKREWIHYVEVVGAMEHNLKDINVKFPLGVITAVTGVSGSGKSSLVGDVLYPALAKHFQIFGVKLGAYRELKGDIDRLTSVEFVDQNTIGKSARSNPVTYLKIYDDIRKIFSDQPFAKLNGFGHSHFSFNIDGGRCSQCLGEGYITVPMQFMADVKMICEECNGKRFKDSVLEVRYNEKNINDILNMSVLEAISFFDSQKESASKRVAQKLRVLDDVGLGYIQLGQSSSSLSGGESQRIKLAQFLSKDISGKGGKNRESIFFIFDEPTTGLHFHDIQKLLKALQALTDKGHTVLVVEHNTDVIKAADWVIDLGPEGGEAGGQICFAGKPEELAKLKGNATGEALR